jgi:hypothetical protein
MPDSASLPTRCAVLVQTAIALGLFIALAIAPPERGALLILPLEGQSQAELAALAVGHGASLLRRGPIGSSLIVFGDRSRLAWSLARVGVLTLNGGAAGCGTPAPAAAR